MTGNNQNNTQICYIAIEGVIGAGKTSVAELLAKKLNARLIMEKFDENPFLEKFYSDPKSYAFRTQLFFLLERYNHLQELQQKDLFTEYIVSDYIFEKDKIFAYLNLDDDELKTYEIVSLALDKNIVSPDLVVYLQSSVEKLMYNIKKRGRGIEQKIEESYIDNLNDAYNYFFSRYKGSKVMIVNCEDSDFLNNPSDFENLFSEIFKSERGAVEYYNPSLRKTAQ